MHARTCKQRIFWSYNTSTFSAICFDENPFKGQCHKEDNFAPLSDVLSGIMAVKGLKRLILFEWRAQSICLLLLLVLFTLSLQ